MPTLISSDDSGGPPFGDVRLPCSIILPVYNERENLGPLVAEIEQAMAASGLRYEIVAVDDGSTDGSLETLRALAADRPALRIVRMAANSGQSAALAAGFRAARGAVAVTLDADLQNDPADIPRLLEALEQADVVSGIRAHRQDSWRRRLASRVANSVRRWVIGDTTTDVGCSLKAYRAAWLETVPFFDGIHRFLPGLLERQGARVVEISVGHRPRRFGESKYTIGGRLGRGLLDLLGVRWLAARWIVEPDRLRSVQSAGEAAEAVDRPEPAAVT